MGGHVRIANNFSSVGTLIDAASNFSSEENANFGATNELLSKVKEVNKVHFQ